MLSLQLFSIYEYDRPNALPMAPYDLLPAEMETTPSSTTDEIEAPINANAMDTSLVFSNSERFASDAEGEMDGPTGQLSEIFTGPS